MNRPTETTLGALAGTATAAAYLTGVLTGYLHRHPAHLAVAALIVSIARSRASRLGR